MNASSTAPRIFLASSSHATQRLMVSCETVMIRRSSDFLLDDGDVALEVVELRQPVVERDQIAQAVDRLQLALLHQLVGERDAVDLVRRARADRSCAGKCACASPG